MASKVQPAWADVSTTQALDPLRLCPLQNLSGYSAIDATGSLINLKQYCQLQVRTQLSHAPFWQAFAAAAAPRAIAYARTLDQEAILAYSDTICPFLENGGTINQLRQIQTSGTLPSEFEVAVTIAAIQTQCPTYQADLGR
ncbi:hypothetical protein IFO70_10060 [Phormidium tenue FACHB-886]|nr:hypothetical protein [Phormidium tenue FACHB-886]